MKISRIVTATLISLSLAGTAFADDEKKEEDKKEETTTADNEVIIYQAGEKPRSGGKIQDAVDTDEVMIYQAGEKPRSGGKIGAQVMAGPDGEGDLNTGTLPGRPTGNVPRR